MVWGPSVREHEKNLLAVLQRIKRISDSGMTLNREKCVFCTKRLKFLDHLLENGQILADPAKTEAIVKTEPPTSINVSDSPSSVQSISSRATFQIVVHYFSYSTVYSRMTASSFESQTKINVPEIVEGDSRECSCSSDL